MISKQQTFQPTIFPMAVILGRGARTYQLIKVASKTFDSIRMVESNGELIRP